MYDINFIGHRIVPAGRRKVIATIAYLSSLFLGLSVIGIGSISLSDYRASEVYASEIGRIREAMTTRYPGTPSQEELETMVRRTEPHLKEIGKLVDGRISCAPIWERIAACVPDEVWLTRVMVSDPRTVAEDLRGRGGHSGSGGKLFRGITIEGVALAGRGPEGDRAVSAFVDNLKKDEELKDYVRDVEFLGTGLRQVDGTSVVGFEITCPF